MKNKKTVQLIWRLSGLLLAGALLGGCASMQPQTPEEQVMSRSQERWDALVTKDAKKAYDLMTPSFRALISQEDFQRRMPSAGRWTGASVHSAKCEAERCQVKVRISASVAANLPGMRRGQTTGVTSYFDEPWVREDGQWWFYEAP